VIRYYDPTTGQFASVDPEVAKTQEPYGYAGDDPVNRSDPSGECRSWFDWSCQAFMQPLKASVEAAGGHTDVDIEQAGTILQANHFGLSDTGDILQSFLAFRGENYMPQSSSSASSPSCPTSIPFGPTINLKELHFGQTLYRYTSSYTTYGSGTFITPHLYTHANIARAQLALPPWNNASQLWYVQPGRDSLVLDGLVAPNFGEPGHGWQDIVLTNSDFSYTYVSPTDAND